MQVSCSLPETPIFARGCDIPRTPHRRAPDVPPTATRTTPRPAGLQNSYRCTTLAPGTGNNTMGTNVSLGTSYINMLLGNNRTRHCNLCMLARTFRRHPCCEPRRYLLTKICTFGGLLGPPPWQGNPAIFPLLSQTTVDNLWEYVEVVLLPSSKKYTERRGVHPPQRQ